MVFHMRITLTLPRPAVAPSLSQWEREGARSPKASGKGEGDQGFDG
jgi:hypothetical protein